MAGRVSARGQELFNAQANIGRDLSEERWRNVATAMERNRGGSPIEVPELLVRAALPNLEEPERLEEGNNLSRLQNRERAQAQATCTLRTSTNSASS